MAELNIFFVPDEEKFGKKKVIVTERYPLTTFSEMEKVTKAVLLLTDTMMSMKKMGFNYVGRELS